MGAPGAGLQRPLTMHQALTTPPPPPAPAPRSFLGEGLGGAPDEQFLVFHPGVWLEGAAAAGASSQPAASQQREPAASQPQQQQQQGPAAAGASGCAAGQFTQARQPPATQPPPLPRPSATSYSLAAALPTPTGALQDASPIAVGQDFVILSVQTGLYCAPVQLPATYPLSNPRTAQAQVVQQGPSRALLQLPVPPSCFTSGLICDQPQSSATFTFTGTGMTYQGASMVRASASTWGGQAAPVTGRCRRPSAGAETQLRCCWVLGAALRGAGPHRSAPPCPALPCPARRAGAVVQHLHPHLLVRPRLHPGGRRAVHLPPGRAAAAAARCALPPPADAADIPQPICSLSGWTGRGSLRPHPPPPAAAGTPMPPSVTTDAPPTPAVIDGPPLPIVPPGVSPPPVAAPQLLSGGLYNVYLGGWLRGGCPAGVGA
jgi:hypothetical protein